MIFFRLLGPRARQPYRLLERLGAGAVGTVYLARTESGRQVAVKVLHRQFAEDAEFRVLSRQEATVARRLSAPSPHRSSMSVACRAVAAGRPPCPGTSPGPGGKRLPPDLRALQRPGRRLRSRFLHHNVPAAGAGPTLRQKEGNGFAATYRHWMPQTE